MVGNGEEAEIVAILKEEGRSVFVSKFAFICPSLLDVDAERSIFLAVEVVFAISLAAAGKG